MLLQFGRLDLEVALQVGDIGADEDGAMVQPLIFAFGKGVAGELAPLAQHIVATTHRRVEAIGFHGTLQHRELARGVVGLVRHDKGEVEVAQVVEDGPASGAAAHQIAAIVL